MKSRAFVPLSLVLTAACAAAGCFCAARAALATPFYLKDRGISVFSYPEQSFEIPYFEAKSVTKSGTFPITSVTLRAYSSGGYVRYGDIYIKDNSTKKADIDKILSDKPEFNVTGKADVLILHTHATERYNVGGAGEYDGSTEVSSVKAEETVVGVGGALEKALEENGIGVIHCTELHDNKNYSGAYSASLESAEKYLEKYPSIQMVIDLHRDSIIASSGVKYRPVTEIDGQNAAQLMFVVGTGSNTLKNDGWRDNLRTAAAVQSSIEKEYPGLCRPLLMRDSRYNMHISKGYILLEAGSCGNTPEEAEYSVRLIAKHIAEVLKG